MLKAENEQGNVRQSKYAQLKRHRKQMDERGINILINKFNKLDKSKRSINKHLLNKKTISFREEDIDKLLNKDIKDMIVEYNQTFTDEILDERIVIRDNEVVQTDKGEQNLCIVLSLIKNEVITAYYNPPDDNHTTIDMNRYFPFPINGI